jgi:hypothetical protein
LDDPEAVSCTSPKQRIIQPDLKKNAAEQGPGIRLLSSTALSAQAAKAGKAFQIGTFESPAIGWNMMEK